jgi:hypothetical protein
MPDQAIIRSQPEGHMARQEAAGPAMQHTLAQLREMRDLPGIVVAELDATYQQLTAYLEKGEDQRRISGFSKSGRCGSWRCMREQSIMWYAARIRTSVITARRKLS